MNAARLLPAAGLLLPRPADAGELLKQAAEPTIAVPPPRPESEAARLRPAAGLLCSEP